MSSPFDSASIIIATRNRAKSLAATLRSIEADGATVRRELLVIDNGSTDDTAQVVARFAAEAELPVRYIVEGNPGQTQARNRGVSEAHGRFLLFTDDDVIVRPGWTDALVAAFENPGIVAVGGRVIPVVSGAIPEWIDGPQLGQVALTDYGPDQVEMDASKAMLPFGANFALRHGALPGPTPFEETLGHVGGMSVGWEEWHLLVSMEAQGGQIVYAPDAVVAHHFDAGRLDYATVRRRHFQNGIGLARHRRLSQSL